MREKFIKITIDKQGKVAFTVEGVKGEACLDATKFLEQALGGKVLAQEPTSEYYEQAEGETVTTRRGS
jgi:DUF2997 family protein